MKINNNKMCSMTISNRGKSAVTLTKKRKRKEDKINRSKS